MRHAEDTKNQENEWPEVWVASFHSDDLGTVREELFGSESEALKWVGLQRLAHHVNVGRECSTWVRKATLVGDGLIKYRRFDMSYGGEQGVNGFYYERHPADTVKRVGERPLQIHEFLGAF